MVPPHREPHTARMWADPETLTREFLHEGPGLFGEQLKRVTSATVCWHPICLSLSIDSQPSARARYLRRTFHRRTPRYVDVIPRPRDAPLSRSAADHPHGLSEPEAHCLHARPVTLAARRR